MVDNHQITLLVNKDPSLKYKFLGCYSRDKFVPPNRGQFVLVSTEAAQSSGEYWLLIASKNKNIVLYDSFGRDFETFFPNIFSKIKRHAILTGQCLYQYKPNDVFMQSIDSTNCGIYCIFMAHFLYSSKQSFKLSKRKLNISDFPAYDTKPDILRFLADICYQVVVFEFEKAAKPVKCMQGAKI